MKKLAITVVILGMLALVATNMRQSSGLLSGFSAPRGFTTTTVDATNENFALLASASYATLNTGSVQLLPAPGIGSVIDVISITGYRLFASESWDNKGALAPTIGFSGGAAITASLSKGFFSGGSGGTTASPSYITVYPVDQVVASNSAVVIRRAGAATPVIDGDTSWKFSIIYKIINLP